jgi:hypothetical protein
MTNWKQLVCWLWYTERFEGRFISRHFATPMITLVHRSLEAKGNCFTDHQTHQHTAVKR